MKVLVLDWDVHHGNGIEEILYGNADIMYISLHRWACLELLPLQTLQHLVCSGLDNLQNQKVLSSCCG